MTISPSAENFTDKSIISVCWAWLVTFEIATDGMSNTKKTLKPQHSRKMFNTAHTGNLTGVIFPTDDDNLIICKGEIVWLGHFVFR